jgi:hypothetical protein
MINQIKRVSEARIGLQVRFFDSLTPGTSTESFRQSGRCAGHELLTVRNRLFTRRLGDQSPYVVLRDIVEIVVLFLAEKAYKV